MRLADILIATFRVDVIFRTTCQHYIYDFVQLKNVSVIIRITFALLSKSVVKSEIYIHSKLKDLKKIKVQCMARETALVFARQLEIILILQNQAI